MGSLGPQLTLSSRFSSEITDALFSRIEPERISELESYVQGLQDEMKKIDAFKRDLPIIIVLLEQVLLQLHAKLDMCKRSVSVSVTEPVLAEFIPIKSSSSGGGDEMMKEMDEKTGNDDNKKENEIVTSKDKRDWMSSVQLWSSDDNQNQCPNTPLRSNSNRPGFKLETFEIKKPEEDIKWPVLGGGLSRHVGEKAPERTAFTPFKRPSSIPVMLRKEDEVEMPKVPGLSLATPEIKRMRLEEEVVMCNGFNSKSCSTGSGSSSGNNVQGQCLSLIPANGQSNSSRKQRRCWSPELHRRFVNALQQLGGAQVATPKQIRELMQVDGLTNDEVKSHLQKYRLHSRKSDGKKSCTGSPLDLWSSAEHESSKPSTSQSGSPPGPLELTGSRDTSMMTLSMGDEYDEKNESRWKTQIHLCG